MALQTKAEVSATRSAEHGQQIMATRRIETPLQANTNWLHTHPSHFNVAAALHLPNAFRITDGGSERALQYKLRSFFTRLDRKVLKSACRKRKMRIPRYVVLEYSPSVGWHMHALLSSRTSKFSAERLCMIIKLMWLEEFDRGTLKGFEPHLGWAKPVTGGYENYMSKKLYGTHVTAAFDEMNSVFG
jgi:hypothetical protein